MPRYRFETSILDTSRRELIRGGESVKLSPRAFQALQILSKSYPDAVSRHDLYAALWPDTFVNLTNLNNVISEIRSAVGDPSKKIVITKHRFGYAIGVPVTVESAARSLRSRFSLSIAGERIILREGENLVGRLPDAAVVLDLPSVSRRHAVIRVSGDRADVEDLHSKNGTFVEDERVEQQYELRDRVIIRFGSVSGVFRAIPAAGTTATEPGVKR